MFNPPEGRTRAPEGMSEGSTHQHCSPRARPEEMSDPPEEMSDPPEEMSDPPEGMSDPPDGMSDPPDGMADLPEGIPDPPSSWEIPSTPLLIKKKLLIPDLLLYTVEGKTVFVLEVYMQYTLLLLFMFAVRLNTLCITFLLHYHFHTAKKAWRGEVL